MKLKVWQVPGIDMAWGFNGYVYHTARDDVDQLYTGFLQHGGENVLPATLAFASAPNIPAIVEKDRDYELGQSRHERRHSLICLIPLVQCTLTSCSDTWWCTRCSGKSSSERSLPSSG